MNPKVDFYFTKAKKWKTELEKLRTIALECGLTEDLKWGVPCYTYEKSNIVLIHVFKDYFAYLFFKGSLLEDHDGILVQQTANVQAGRQIRFTGMNEILDKEAVLKAYIYAAIEIEKAGLKVAFKTPAELVFPAEFEAKIKEVSGFKAAFNALSPGRQKEYSLYFSQPKQAKTRESRIEKSVERIKAGKGLNDF